VRAALSGGGLTMTSFPVCNKTSLSRKPCIPDIKLLWNAIIVCHYKTFNVALKLAFVKYNFENGLRFKAAGKERGGEVPKYSAIIINKNQ